MKVYSSSAVSLLLQIAFAELININEDLDRALTNANKILTSKGKGLIKLRALAYGNIQLLDGVLVGANSLTGTGDATLCTSRENKSFQVDLHVGQGIYELSFGRIKLNGSEMSGSFNVKTNSFHANFSLLHYNDTDCSFHLNRYEYESLTDATFKSSLHQYSGDVSEMFANTILPKINERVTARKDRVEKAAKARFCKKPVLRFQQFLLEILVLLLNI